MALMKTTILPTDDDALACSMAAEWVDQRPHVLWFSLGAGAEAETTAARGDWMAGTPDDARWCLWSRKPEQLRPIVARLKLGRWTIEQILAARAFTLSRDDEVRDVLLSTEPVPNFGRAELAFENAEGSAT